MKADLKIMRDFAALRPHLTRTEAIAAAKWMLEYARDTRRQWRHGNLSRTRTPSSSQSTTKG